MKIQDFFKLAAETWKEAGLDLQIDDFYENREKLIETYFRIGEGKGYEIGELFASLANEQFYKVISNKGGLLSDHLIRIPEDLSTREKTSRLIDSAWKESGVDSAKYPMTPEDLSKLYGAFLSIAKKNEESVSEILSPVDIEMLKKYKEGLDKKS